MMVMMIMVVVVVVTDYCDYGDCAMLYPMFETRSREMSMAVEPESSRPTETLGCKTCFRVKSIPYKCCFILAVLTPRNYLTTYSTYYTT